MATGLTYQWQSSPDNATWSNVAGGTGMSLTTSQSASSWYRAIVTCTSAGLSDTSGSVQVTSPGLISGTFTIDAGAPTGGSNFQTFAEAVNYIACGINGPVVFNVAPGTYSEQVVIPQIGGTSATNTITFKGNLASLSPNISSTTNRAAILLQGADHVIIDSLIIDVSAGTSGWGVALTGQADSNRVSNCVITTSASSTSSNYMGLVISGSSSSYTTSGNNGNGNLFQNNTINGGYYGISLYGNSAAGAQNLNNVVSGNIVNNTYGYAIYLVYQSGALVDSNEVSRTSRTNSTTTGGVFLSTNVINTRVEQTRVHNMFDAMPTSTSTFYGIYVSGVATAGNENKLINNLIYTPGGNGTVYGIYNSSGAYMQAYHNTIAFDDVAATTGTAYGFYQTGTAAGISFRNNIVVITRTGTGIKRNLYFVTTGSTITSNNNLLYMNVAGGTNNNLGQWGTTNYATLANWQTANGAAYDQQSVSSDPMFSNPASGDYTPTDGTINNLGAALGVTNDITGAPRNMASPDLGAYEFSGPPCVNPPTAGTAVSTATSVCDGVSFTLSLTGNSVGENQTYQWQTSPDNATWTNVGTASTSSLYTTSLTAGSSVWYRAAVQCGAGTIVYSSSVQVVSPSLVAGTYTINSAAPTGGGNFQTFGDAINSIKCGINGPVVFNVMAGSGPYPEQVTIPAIAGASATNTITFKGNGATVSYNSSDANNRTAIILNGADHVIIDSLVIDVSAGTYGWGVLLTNRADSNVISNCTILNNTASTGTNFLGIAINGSGTGTAFSGNNGNGNLITRNTITGGYYGVYIYGSTTTYNKFNTISNNLAQEFYSYGIYVYGNDSVTVSKNEITRPTRTAVTTTYCIYISTNTAVTVEKNRIHNLFGGATTSTSTCYGIYFAASGSSATPNRVENNLIYTLQNNGAHYGVYSLGYNYNNFYHNTIALDDASSTAGTTYGMYVYGTSGVNIRNNIVYVTRGGTGTKYLLYFSTTGVAVSNNNILWMGSTSGTNNIGYFSGAQATFANWQAVNSSAWDQQSVNADPVFANPAGGDYTPTNAAVDNLAIPVGVTEDINDSTRSVATPDIGAIEWSAPACTGSNGGTITAVKTSFCGPDSTFLSAAGYSDGSQATYQWQYSNDNFVSDSTNAPGANSPLSYSTGVISATRYYRLRVTCAATGTTGYSNILEVTVNPIPTVSVTPASPSAVCEPDAVVLSLGTTSATSPGYQWQLGGADIGGANGTSHPATVSGSYRLKVTDGVTTCSGYSNAVVVTVNPKPSDVTFGAASYSVCPGSSAQMITVSGGTISNYPILTENFNGTAAGWTTVNNTTGGSNPAAAAWTLTPSGATYSSNDASQFYFSNSDAAGSGNNTLTILTSPAFSTVGFVTGNLTFYQYYNDYDPSDFAYVEASTDGTTWTNLATYSTDMGTSTGFVQTNIDLSAFLGQPTVYVRFRYVAVWGFYWAIDNVSISGTQSTTLAWSPATGLFTDPAAITPYAGSNEDTLYALPSGNQVYQVTATSTAGCADTSTIAVNYNTTVTNSTNLAGTAGGGQVCANYSVSTSNNFFNNCNIIATVTPSGASPVSGNVNACVTIDGTPQTANGQYYVQRHYDITPATNPATSTATVTLYFLQSEFNAYNSVVDSLIYPKLPANGSDAAGIANLRISQFHGTGTNPSNYTGPGELIDPVDANVVWNASANRWEITFNVTGFSGFYVHTRNFVLPVTITDFKGELAGTVNKLMWTTATETNNAGFELQRSADGISFSGIAYVASKATGGNSTTALNYGFDDEKPLAGNSYYRLKQVDKNGKFSYSNIVLLSRKVKDITLTNVYPSPATRELNVVIIAPASEKVTLVVTDLTGKVIMQLNTKVVAGENLERLNVQQLAAGTYVIKAICANGCETAVQRFVKH
ncbi:MAG TPA: right-handed parallel beta-helix repeat-containing protein [Chitinophagaceae bacterium]